MTADPSNGWEAAAEKLIASRSGIGVATVRTWAAALAPGGSILDLGCGSGVPLAAALVADGFVVAGIDASPTLAAAFGRRFPDADVACEPAERSGFFGRRFDGAMAIGLLFLLTPSRQRALIDHVAGALKPRGRFLFTAPKQACQWTDITTGHRSRSLGAEAYRRLLADAGMSLVGDYVDEGGNCYHDALKGDR